MCGLIASEVVMYIIMENGGDIISRPLPLSIWLETEQTAYSGAMVRRSSSDLDDLMPDHFSKGVPAKLEKLTPVAIEAIKKLYHVAFLFNKCLFRIYVCVPASPLHFQFSSHEIKGCIASGVSSDSVCISP